MRGRRTITDLGLVAVALLLVGLWLSLGRSPSTDSTAHEPFAVLKEHPPAWLTLVVGNDQLTLQKATRNDAASRYQIQGQPQRSVEPAAVDRLLQGLSELAVLRDVPKPDDEKRLGLAPPQLTLKFDLHGEPALLAMGTRSPTSAEERYARLTVARHSRIVVLPQAQAALLDVTPESLIERRALDWVPSDVAELTLDRGFSRLTLRHLENGRYLVASEPPRRAKRKDVEALLVALTELRFERDLAPDVTHIEPHDARLVATLSPFPEREQAPVTLTFGGACPTEPKLVEVIVQSTTVRAGCVLPSLFELLPADEKSLFDEHLFFLHGDEVETLLYERPPTRLVLERQGAAFVLREPTTQAVELGAGNAMLDALTAAQGQPAGACRAELMRSPTTITLRSGIVGKAGPTDERLHVGEPRADGSVSVCRDDDQELLLSRELASVLELEPELLSSPELLALPFDSIDEVTITSPAGHQRLARSDDFHLYLVEPGVPGDAASIESLKEQLAQLSAERRLPRATRHARTDEPHTVVRFSASVAERPRESHALRLYTSDTGLAYATLDDSEAPFVLGATTTRLLEGLLVDRSLYRLTESDGAFSLSRGEDQLRCERSQEGFVCPSWPMPKERLEQLVAELSELRAVRVDQAPSPRTRGAVTLRVYGASAKEPRFQLTLWSCASDAGESLSCARAHGSTLRLMYERETLQRLEALFPPHASAP